MKVFFRFFFITVLCVFSCKKEKPFQSFSIKYNEATFFDYLTKADSVYAIKTGLNVLSSSLKYIDTATVIAQHLQDAVLIGEAIFAKGRIYDAWNKKPQKTIQYFSEAADIFSKQKGLYRRYLYAKFLVAHAYDKIQDSTNCVAVLREMYDEILPKNDSIKKALIYIPEMALASTEVGNYQLANDIFTHLVKEKWIQNDPETYHYRDRYFLTKSRIDVYDKKLQESPYIDSLLLVYQKTENTFDSLFYSHELQKLYGAIGKYAEAYQYVEENYTIYRNINNSSDMLSFNKALHNLELKSKRQEQVIIQKTAQFQYLVIAILLLIIGFLVSLSIQFFKAKKIALRVSLNLKTLNEQLEEKVGENVLLNKELHHRTKNNLYMIFSLLQMQERKIKGAAAKKELKTARLRIESLAIAHEQMVIGNESLDFEQLIKRLISALTLAGASEKTVNTQLDIEPISMSSENRFSLALILNEWLSNTLKHATPVNGHILIFVRIQKAGEDIIIEYKDNGKQSAKEKTGLGTQIIALLVKKMQATVTVNDKNPFAYLLRFKAKGND